MSKSIIIQKNGTAQTLALDKLRLPKHGGGTEDWLPADGKNLVKIVVKQNGTYKASDFGAYGISEVKVACTLSGGSATSAAVEKAVKALHNPCPAEGGLARVMSAHHLETLLSTTGSCQWVPEAEVSLGTKYINVDNKTYKAADDGKYGYSQVTVSGISITKDGDTITHTDGTGTKTYRLPHHIRVEHPPLKFTYNDGETIDFFDMLVKAYNEDGTVWTDETHPGGVIPLEELILPVTVADITKATGVIYTSPDTFVVDGVEFNEKVTAKLTKYISRVPYGIYGKPYYSYSEALESAWGIGTDIAVPNIENAEGTYSLAVVADNGVHVLYASAVDFGGCSSCGVVDKPPDNYGNKTAGVTAFGCATYTFDGKTVYYMVNTVQSFVTAFTIPVASINQNWDRLAWYLIYGAMSYHSQGQTIPVQWARPWDAEILEDTFTITVTESSFGGAEGGGGQTSGGGAGRDN